MGVCRTHYAFKRRCRTRSSTSQTLPPSQPSSDRLLDYVEDKLTRVFAHLDRAREDLLSFTAFPKEIWTQIWSNNPAERLNKEIRRCTDARRRLP